MKNEEKTKGSGKREIFKISANGVFMIFSGFLLAMIICLFLFQPKEGTRVESTMDEFEENSQQYYDEDESYRQVNDNIDTYKASGRPD